MPAKRFLPRIQRLMNMSEEKKNHRERAENTILVSASAFPLELWKEWDKDCQEQFSDCRWIKMWTDHIKAKQVNKIEEFERRLVELEVMIQNKPKEEVKEEFVETLGGRIKKGD